jgi:hypothetical protein
LKFTSFCSKSIFSIDDLIGQRQNLPKFIST